MIEPTDEMYEALFDAGDACGGEFASKEDVLRGLAAVLAIVERDYQVIAICREELVPGLRCTRQLIPAYGHRGDHEGKTSTGNTVKWS